MRQKNICILKKEYFKKVTLYIICVICQYNIIILRFFE